MTDEVWEKSVVWHESGAENGDFRLLRHKNGRPKPRNISSTRLSPGVRKRLQLAEPKAEVAVEYLSAGGTLRGVRLPGEDWGWQDLVSGQPENGNNSPSVSDTEFLNPYAFVRPFRQADGPLADGPPVGHERFDADRWSGSLAVTLTTQTPLLILDDATATVEKINGKSHRTYEIRSDRAGRADLGITAVKGALRSAVEAVTGSRFGVWSSRWDNVLAYREPANVGSRLVPVRIRFVDGTPKAEVFEGHPANGNPSVQAAAWLPMYGHLKVSYQDGDIPSHGDKLWAELVLVRHYPWQKPKGNESGKRMPANVTMWRATRIGRTKEELNRAPKKNVTTKKVDGYAWYEPVATDPIQVEGVALINGRSIKGKHDERIAFGPTAKLADIEDRALEGYASVIRSFADARKNGNTTPQGFEAGRYNRDSAKPELADGDLAFAELHNGKVIRLTPSFIGRRPWKITPKRLAEKQRLLPPTSFGEFSTADRMFGWVNADGTGAFGGHVRIHHVTCESTDSVDLFDQPRVLATLSAPKPTQGRFYLGDEAGRPLGGEVKKHEIYDENRTVRGRKFYWHHRNEPDQMPHAFAKQGAKKTDQNRSITAQIRCGTRFNVDIRFDNLSDEELGALLWVLSPDGGGRLRLGYGKPIGFGSVAVEVDHERSRIFGAKGGERPPLAQRYRSLAAQIETATAAQLSALMQRFEELAEPIALADYRSIMAGSPTKRVHYPLVSGQAVDAAADESYEWFVSNEAESGSRRSLPPASPTGGAHLPYLARKKGR